MSAIMRRRRSLIGLSRIKGSCPEVGGVGTPNPQDGTPAPSSSVDQLVGAILAACSSPARAGSFHGRVEMWRGCGRPNISVAAPFVWRRLTGSAVAPFPYLAHRTGRADFPHPALGQDITPSPTARCAHARSGVRDRNARRDARVDTSRSGVA